MYCDNCLSNHSNALHSSIGQNKKITCVSGLRYPISDVRSPAQMAINSATRHPIDFVFGSRFGILARTD